MTKIKFQGSKVSPAASGPTLGKACWTTFELKPRALKP
jgi:hypothetical protein